MYERPLFTNSLISFTQIDATTRKESHGVMTPSREEERMVETLWATSARVHEETRRRQSCVEWMHHHGHLADVFRGHADRHARQQERYRQILQTMSTNEGESDERIPA